jgi:UDP-2,3-diacylglucosamine pyrophosphatase LpxH
MLELQSNTLIVLVSDPHIGGDPGCDGFESPEELEALFEELAGREAPVELVLAGDFYDFLQIGHVPDGADRAALTISRPEYERLFAALARFKSGEQKRVVYLPGNHDAEMWWNPKIQKTLKGRGLVDEFALSYLASFRVEGERKIVYCEHGNQFDPANTIEDYSDPLDTPLGHHVVMDFTRRIAPFGEVSRGLDLSEIKNVYPLVQIPQWIASRYFYNFLGKATAYLLLPLLAAYVVYRFAAYFLAVARDDPTSFFRSYQELTQVHALFLDIGIFGLVTLLIFAIFFLVVRRVVRKTVATITLRQKVRYSPAETSQDKIQKLVQGEASPPMESLTGSEHIDVFVSGHTHRPSLDELKRGDGKRGVVVNSGCWLRQLQPVSPHLKGPPVFVSKFVLTHVRVFMRGSSLRVELWEHPRPAGQRMTRIERILSWNRRPPQPTAGSKPRVRAAVSL